MRSWPTPCSKAPRSPQRGRLQTWIIAAFMSSWRAARVRDPAELADWRGPELASLGWLLGLRVLRGSFLRLRLGHAAGLVFCERHVRVLHARHVSAGRDLNLEEGCQVMGLSKRGIVFGDRCTVGRYAQIAPTGILGGIAGEGLTLGDNSNIGPYSFIGCSGYIEIGASASSWVRASTACREPQPRRRRRADQEPRRDSRSSSSSRTTAGSEPAAPCLPA